MRSERDLLKKEITIVAYAGEDAANSKIPLVVNDYLGDNNLAAHLIGISIRDDDFDFFIKNLKSSKVEVTVFAEEFQKRAAEGLGAEGFLIAAFKKGDRFVLVTEDEPLLIDDKRAVLIVEKILKERKK